MILGIDFFNPKAPDEKRAVNAVKDRNEKTLRALVEKVNQIKATEEMADIVTIADLYSELENNIVRRATTNRPSWRGFLEVADSQIGVHGYLRTQEAKLPTPRKISGRAHDGRPDGDEHGWGLLYQLQLVNPLNPEEELVKEDLVKAYRYGRTLVNCDVFQESHFKFVAEKCLRVIAFAPLHQIPRHYFMGTTEYFVPDPHDTVAQRAFRSLVDALAVKEQVAICRYCKRNGATVHLYALFSQFEDQQLVGVNLPFLNDVRDYDFPDLTIGSADGLFAKLPRLKPTEEQMEATSAVVHALDLTKGGATDNDEPLELLIPEETRNPVLAYFNTCLKYRALNPKERLLPDPPHNLMADVEQMLKKAADDLELFKKIFPLEKTAEQKKLQRSWWADQLNAAPDIQLQDTAAVPDNSKKRKAEQIGDFDLDIDMDKLLNPGVGAVSTVTPVSDFEEMIKRVDVDLVDKAINEMRAVIFKLINDSIGPQFYAKALSCIQALRKGCIANEETEFFNECLSEVQKTYAFKKRDDFWQQVVKAGVTLISSDEAEDSFVTVQQAKDFLSARVDVAAPAPVILAPSNADDDDPMNFID